MNAAEKKTYQCDKCLGTGIVSAYIKIDNGFCYKCNGSGKLSYMPLAERMANQPAKAKQPYTTYQYQFGCDTVTVITNFHDGDGSVNDCDADVVSYDVYYKYYADKAGE